MLNACAQSIAAAQGEADLAPGKVRRKMAVGEGRSMMHWMNVRPKIKRQRWVTMDEIKQVVKGPWGRLGTLKAIGLLALTQHATRHSTTRQRTHGQCSEAKFTTAHPFSSITLAGPSSCWR